MDRQTVATIELVYEKPTVDVALAAESAKTEAREIEKVSNYDVKTEVVEVKRVEIEE